MSKHVKALRDIGKNAEHPLDRKDAALAADHLERTEKRLWIAMKALKLIDDLRLSVAAGYALKEMKETK
jgi:hypothetical protein